MDIQKKTTNPHRDTFKIIKDRGSTYKEVKDVQEKDVKKESKTVRKQKIKEKEKEIKNALEDDSDELQDYVPFRMTRSQVKKDTSESLSSKSRDKSKKGGAARGSKIAETSTAKANNKQTKPAARGRPKSKLLLDKDEEIEYSNHHNRNRRGRKHSDNEEMDLEVSKSPVANRSKVGRSGLEEAKSPNRRMNIEASTNKISLGHGKADNDLTNSSSLFNGIEYNTSSTADSLTSRANLDKRSNLDLLKDYPSPICNLNKLNKTNNF